MDMARKSFESANGMRIDFEDGKNDFSNVLKIEKLKAEIADLKKEAKRKTSKGDKSRLSGLLRKRQEELDILEKGDQLNSKKESKAGATSSKVHFEGKAEKPENIVLDQTEGEPVMPVENTEVKKKKVLAMGYEATLNPDEEYIGDNEEYLKSVKEKEIEARAGKKKTNKEISESKKEEIKAEKPKKEPAEESAWWKERDRIKNLAKEEEKTSSWFKEREKNRKEFIAAKGVPIEKAYEKDIVQEESGIDYSAVKTEEEPPIVQPKGKMQTHFGDEHFGVLEEKQAKEKEEKAIAAENEAVKIEEEKLSPEKMQELMEKSAEAAKKEEEDMFKKLKEQNAADKDLLKTRELLLREQDKRIEELVSKTKKMEAQIEQEVNIESPQVKKGFKEYLKRNKYKIILHGLLAGGAVAAGPAGIAVALAVYANTKAANREISRIEKEIKDIKAKTNYESENLNEIKKDKEPKKGISGFIEKIFKSSKYSRTESDLQRKESVPEKPKGIEFPNTEKGREIKKTVDGYVNSLKNGTASGAELYNIAGVFSNWLETEFSNDKEMYKAIYDSIYYLDPKIHAGGVKSMLEYAMAGKKDNKEALKMALYLTMRSKMEDIPGINEVGENVKNWLNGEKEAPVAGENEEEKNLYQEKEFSKIYDLGDSPEDFDNIKLLLEEGGGGKWARAVDTLIKILKSDYKLVANGIQGSFNIEKIDRDKKYIKINLINDNKKNIIELSIFEREKLVNINITEEELKKVDNDKLPKGMPVGVAAVQEKAGEEDVEKLQQVVDTNFSEERTNFIKNADIESFIRELENIEISLRYEYRNEKIDKVMASYHKIMASILESFDLNNYKIKSEISNADIIKNEIRIHGTEKAKAFFAALFERFEEFKKGTKGEDKKPPEPPKSPEELPVGVAAVSEKAGKAETEKEKTDDKYAAFRKDAERILHGSVAREGFNIIGDSINTDKEKLPIFIDVLENEIEKADNFHKLENIFMEASDIFQNVNIDNDRAINSAVKYNPLFTEMRKKIGIKARYLIKVDKSSSEEKVKETMKKIFWYKDEYFKNNSIEQIIDDLIQGKLGR